MTGYVHIYHLCLAALLAGCATIAQLDEAEPTAKQAASLSGFSLSQRSTRRCRHRFAVAARHRAFPASANGPKGNGPARAEI